MLHLLYKLHTESRRGQMSPGRRASDPCGRLRVVFSGYALRPDLAPGSGSSG
jgi:hypothetical protein